MNNVPAAGPQVTAAKGLKGSTYGGRSPIKQAAIQLWQTGTTAYGSGTGSNATVVATATTNDTGQFYISSFTCASGTELYITSSGGDPGNGTNPAAILFAGLTSCDNASSLTFVNIDEVTTVASAYALQAFAGIGQSFASGVQIGAPQNNQTGLAQAMADVQTLVDLPSGLPLASTSSVTLPQAQLNTLANALVQCVNTTGSSSHCSTLYTYAPDLGGNLPQDTLAAAFNIARTSGGSHVSDLVNFGGGIAVPFTPVLLNTPADLMLAVTYTGSGINSPSGAALDQSGNVWIANAASASGTGSITELTHTGTALSGPSGYTAGGINAPSAIAIDATGSAWIANAGNATVSQLAGGGIAAPGSPFSGGGLSAPVSLAIDSDGSVWVANSGINAVSKFSSSGVAQSGSSGFAVGSTSAPLALAINPK